MLTCGRREPHRSQYLKHSRSSPRKNRRPSGSLLRLPLPLLSILVAFLELGPLWFFVCSVLEHHSTVWYSAAPCRSAHLSSAQLQLSFSSASVQCSAVECSTRLSTPPVQVSKRAGWLAGGTSLVLCVLCRPFPGPPRSGLRCFARWIIHICCPLALECNLKTSQLQPYPSRLVPVNCIVATHARHFVCIDPAPPCALPWPHTRPDSTHTIGAYRQTVLRADYSRYTDTDTDTFYTRTHTRIRIHARPFGQSSLTHQGMLFTLACAPTNPCELREWIDSALGQSQTPLARGSVPSLLSSHGPKACLCLA